jgi:exodeoxyribonuclease VII small subunit
MAKIIFEKALERLNQIVADLEDGNLSLDKALEKYEEGIKLTKECTKQLQEAEKKVERLIKVAEGEYDTEAFEEGSSTEQKGSKAKAKKRTKKNVSDDDLLFS